MGLSEEGFEFGEGEVYQPVGVAVLYRPIDDLGQKRRELDLVGVGMNKTGQEAADFFRADLGDDVVADAGEELTDMVFAVVVGEVADDEGGYIVAADGGADVFAGEEFVLDHGDDGLGDPRPVAGDDRGAERDAQRPPEKGGHCEPVRQAADHSGAEAAGHQAAGEGVGEGMAGDEAERYQPERYCRFVPVGRGHGSAPSIISFLLYYVFPRQGKSLPSTRITPRPFRSPPIGYSQKRVRGPQMLGGSVGRAATRTRNVR